MTDQAILDFRRALTLTLSLGALFLVVCGLAALPLLDFSMVDLRGLAASIGGISATVGGIYTSVYFLTAQVSSNGLRGYGLPSIYRTTEVVLVLIAIASSVTLALLSLGAPREISWATAYLTWIAAVLAVYVVSMIAPIGLIQIENLSYSMIALKLVRAVTYSHIREWSLVDLRRTPDGAVGKLIPFQFDFYRRDPLRPVHDLVESAMVHQDHHLAGRIVSLLLARVGDEYGVAGPDGWLCAHSHQRIRARRRDRETSDDSLRLTLHILHYVLRLSAFRLKRIGERDRGRHAISIGCAKLVTALSSTNANSAVIRWLLFVILHTSLAYRDELPLGEQEPLTELMTAPKTLLSAGRRQEAELCVRVLAVIQVQTRQLSPERAGNVAGSVPRELRVSYSDGLASARAGRLPGSPLVDPWWQSAVSPQKRALSWCGRVRRVLVRVRLFRYGSTN